MDVYQNCPVMESEGFMLRPVEKGDCPDLLRVYSDEKAAALFNSDNCHGDDFHYQTPERMAEAIRFWEFSYQNRYFVRWSIVNRKTQEAVGTIEIFRREAEDFFTDTALLRLDLRSDHEREDVLRELMILIVETAYDLFGCDTITTKAVPAAETRRRVLEAMGFAESQNTLKGHDGTLYRHYYIRSKNA